MNHLSKVRKSIGLTQSQLACLVDKIGNVGAWTAFVQGAASSNANDYLDAFKDQVMTAEDGKALTEKIDFSIAGVMQGTLTDVQNAQVSSQQFGVAYTEISSAKVQIADANQAFAEFKQLVAVQFGENAAEILSVQTAQATTDSAVATLKTTVQATTQSIDALTGRVNTAESSIVSISQAQTNTDSALATFEQQTTATFNEQQAAINQKFTSYADAATANAIYTLKAGVKYNGVYYDAGISVAVIANGSAVSTRVAINANELVMLSGSSTSNMYSPFAVVNGQVFLNDAFIQNASITTAKIQDAAITTAKILDAAITNAKISGNLWSANFVAGSSGWIVRQDGSAEFNNVLVRGTVQADSFIGDVANAQVFADTGTTNDSVSRTFTYTDSTNSNLEKHITLMAVFQVSGSSGAATATFNIAGQSKSYSVFSTNTTTACLMFSARVTSRVVNCSMSLTRQAGITANVAIFSPTMLIARGGGSFAQTN